MAALKITLWCEVPDDMPESDVAMALEQGELFEKFPGTQYQIDQEAGR